MKKKLSDSTININLDGTDALNAIQDQLKELRHIKDKAYYERNQLLLVLCKLFPSYRALHDINDTEWEKNWRNIIVVKITQYIENKPVVKHLTWHIHDSELQHFEFLPLDESFEWDGLKTEEKYDILRSISPVYYNED